MFIGVELCISKYGNKFFDLSPFPSQKIVLKIFVENSNIFTKEMIKEIIIIKVVKITRSDLFFIINYANMRLHIFSLFSLFSRSCCLKVNWGSLQMRENVRMYCKKKLILCEIYFVVRSHFIVNTVSDILCLVHLFQGSGFEVYFFYGMRLQSK
jgi:hypothetical protein